MRRALPTALLLVMIPTLVFAQAGVLCLFADQNGTTCSLTDTVPGALFVYVIHKTTPGVTAVEFAAPKPPCMADATWLGDSSPFPVVIGDSQTGVSIGYGACLSSPIHVLTISYAVSGTTPADCPYPVLPHPAQAHVQMVDCNSTIVFGTGGQTYINSTLPCDCAEQPVPPILNVVPASLTFAFNQATKTLNVQNTGGGTLTWSASPDAFWMSLNPASGTGAATIQVTVDRTGLATGTYTGTITVNSNGGTAAIPVTLNVVSDQTPILAVSPATLDFGTASSTDVFTIANVGGGTLNWAVTETIPWLTAVPTDGSGNQTVGVIVDRTGLSPGVYTGSIGVTSNGGSGQIAVTMEVPTPTPVLGFSPSSLSFSATTDSLPLSIVNTGDPGLQWSISSNQPWLSAHPSSGVEDAQVSVRVDRTGLADGTFSGMLTITSNGGNGTVPVNMVVASGPVLAVDPTLLLYSTTVTTHTFDIINTGIGSLQWSLSTDRPWIQITPPLSGSGGATVTVTVVPQPTNQVGHVTVNSNGGTATVEVRFNGPPPPIAGAIGLYSDPGGQDCAIIDTGPPGLLTVYVVHTLTPGAAASRFSAPKPACMTDVVYLADATVFPVTIGSSQTGVSVGYAACLAGPIHVLTIQYFGIGASQSCCAYDVLPDPASTFGSVEVVGCANQLLLGVGGQATVNPDGTCGCGALVKVEESTWGRIKAMYGPKPGDR